MLAAVLVGDPGLQQALTEALRAIGYLPTRLPAVDSGPPAPDLAAVLVDDDLPGLDGVLRGVREFAPQAGVVALSRRATPRALVDALERGADEVLRKPFDLPSLARALEGATSRGRVAVAPRVVTADPAMARVVARVDAAAASDVTVTLIGEHGTGKSLLARRLHGRGARRHRPLGVLACCDLLPGEALAELCGEEVGNQVRPGRIELSHGGTLVVDEIGEMPPEAQEVLLTLVQTRQVLPLGLRRPVQVDLRLVVTSTRPLAELVASGRLSPTLARRIEVVPIGVPPLRERRGDVAPLARHFLARLAESERRPPATLSQTALGELEGRDWPGNVRELENWMRRAALLFPGAPVELERIEGELRASDPAGAAPLNLKQLERAAIVRALHASRGNRSLAAEALGISPRTLRDKIRRYGLA